jgi:type VI secretion system secreted protein VgrG
MGAAEGISQLFRIQMELVSHEGGIEFEQIVGKPVGVELVLDGGSSRHFHGIVSRFWQGGAVHVDADARGLVSYRADVVPWLWTLTRATNCRVFENQSAPDIIRKVFDDLGYRENEDYEFASLGEAHEEIPYCVQYRETDFNFVSRLMEEQGIAYYFRHEAEKHTMVMFDTSAGCPDCEGYETMLYGGIGGSEGNEKVLAEWSTEQVLPPGKYALNGYDLENPSDDLLAPTPSALSMGGNSKYEIYDYPPYYFRSSEGQRYVKFRMEAEEAASHVVQGRGCCGAFTPGMHITLKGHFCDVFNNKRYLMTRVQHSISQVVGRAGGGSSYANSFSCLPERIPYRPMQKTPKPSIQGSQTAVVVGPSGEEIHCDPYGRVRIQFHWDRGGKDDGTDVCWARVSQSIAGKKWGALFIPRIGQEVVVTFLDGDPDRPLITGMVYNGEQMPPYELDANKTQSGIKTRSSKGGAASNFNEIRMEDKKGSEEFFMQAEKDMNLNVKNNRSKTVAADETQSIGANQTVQVGADETRSVGANRTRSVGSNETVTVTLTRTHSVGVNEMINVGAAQEITVGGAQAITVGAAQAITVGAVQTTNVGASQSTSVGSNRSLEVGGNLSEQVEKDWKHKTGKNIVFEAGDQIAFKTGKAKIIMKKNGDITIEGKKITIKGSGDIVMKGKKILQN